MEPKELQRKWNLTNMQLAFALGKSEQTVKAYKASENARSRRNVPESVKILCKYLDASWQHNKGANIYF